ncbi:MAG: hypothetical protein JWM74_157 [Myxococcaceae bacterium]|nr:hypothetical protein [Myxococcaceae bacterium]
MRMKKTILLGGGSFVFLALAGCGNDAPATPAMEAGGDASPIACAQPNGCGGCASLADKAGDACDATGATWTCSGIDTLTCAHAPSAPQDVTATRDLVEHVHVTWKAPPTGVPSSYVIRRDAFEIGKVDASSHSFDDSAAEPGSLGAPTDLVATQGTRTDGVALSWSMQGESKRTHAYEVVAVYEPLRSAPAGPAIGERPANGAVYEFSRDDGATWNPAGTSTTFLDVGAPLGSISDGAATTRVDYPRSSVHLEVEGMPRGTLPVPSAYRVRGLAAGVRTTASSRTIGYRGVGRPMFQWQRSAADSDGAYADVPGVTGSVWLDDTAPLTGATRYFRARMTADGAAPATTTAAPGARFAMTAVQMSGARNLSCGLRIDGDVGCWGESYKFPPGKYAQLAMSSGSGPDCALALDGHLVCTYGAGASALPGNYKRVVVPSYWNGCGIDLTDHLECTPNFTADASYPSAAETFTALAGTVGVMCGLRTDGKLRCWGEQTSSQALPVAGPTTESYTALSVGGYWYDARVCAIREDHKLVCWGNSAYGLPLGVSTNDYRAVSTSSELTCALRESDGSLECWGDNPPQDPSVESFVSVSVARRAVTALRADGTMASWATGQRVYPKPRTEAFRELAIGQTFSCGITESGELTCFGVNAPSTTSVATNSALHVAILGQSTVCVLRSDRTIGCWSGTNAPVSPVTGLFDSFSGAESPSSLGHACALRADGKVLCWGDNEWQQSPPGPSVDEFKSVSVSSITTCGVRKDDTAVCWGYPISPQSPVGTFREVVAATDHACGLRMDKKIVCWGAVTFGPSSSTYEHVFAHPNTTQVFGLRADGEVDVLPAGFGDYNVRPQPDAFDGLTFTPDGGTCGLRRDKHLMCWRDFGVMAAP